MVDLSSHLLQMRGLKLRAQVSETWSRTSHLLQMRGLKPLPDSRNYWRFQVASFTDAWIETEINDINEHVNLSHLLQMRGLKP